MRVFDFKDWQENRVKRASASERILSNFDRSQLRRRPRNPFERRWLEAHEAGSKFEEVAPAEGEKRFDIEQFASYDLEDVEGDRFRIVIEGPRKYKWLFAAKIGGLEISSAERAAWTDDDN